MIEKKREIYTKVEKIKEIVEIMSNIKDKEEEINELFALYDKLNLEENKLFENWSNYLDDIVQKLDHVTL
jgi:DNA repair exonuclease SbcCD ATPase subunit